MCVCGDKEILIIDDTHSVHNASSEYIRVSVSMSVYLGFDCVDIKSKPQNIHILKYQLLVSNEVFELEIPLE